MSAWVRQAHRWVAIAFTLAVIANLVALWRESQSVWVGVLALIPLVMLLLSGLVLFVLPCVKRARGVPRIG